MCCLQVSVKLGRSNTCSTLAAPNERLGGKSWVCTLDRSILGMWYEFSQPKSIQPYSLADVSRYRAYISRPSETKRSY